MTKTPAKAKPKETEKERRARHVYRLAGAWYKCAAMPADKIERVVRAVAYAVMPGTQRKNAAYAYMINAAYMIKAREDAVRAACRALRRAK